MKQVQKSLRACNKVFIVLAVFLAFAKSYGQNSHLIFREISSFPELSQTLVSAIAQDQRGFLWIGTYNGLYKYDGTRLFRFQKDRRSNNAFPVGPIINLVTTKNNHLWVNIQNEALVDVDLTNETFKAHRHEEKDTNTITSNFIWDIKADTSDDIWISFQYGELDKYDQKLNRFVHFKPEQFKPTREGFMHLFIDENNKIWTGTNFFGLYTYDISTKKIVHHNINGEEKANLGPTNVIKDKKGWLWCLSYNCIFRIDAEANHPKILLGSFVYTPNQQNIGDGPMLLDGDELWIGTYTGLYIYSIRKDTMVRYVHNENDPLSINSSEVRCLFKDRSGNIWIGTEEGLTKISRVQRQFSILRHENGIPSGLAKKEVRSIYVDRSGAIWAGTTGEGLNVYEHAKWLKYYFNAHNTQYGFNYANCIYPLQDDRLMIGTARGLQLFDPAKKAFIQDSFFTGSLNNNKYNEQVWSILEVRKDKLLIGTRNNGLYYIDLQADKILKCDNAPYQREFAIWTIFRDKDNDIWAGTNKGLLKVVQKDKGFGLVKPLLKSNADLMERSNIFNIYEDRNGLLWLGTSDEGLKRYNKKTGEIITYSENAGFPTDIISGLLEDDHGNFWLSTMYGICVFDPGKGKVIRRYDASDGLSSNHFNFKACCETSSGQMYFGTSDGINYFYPDSIKVNTYLPNVFITSFKVLYNEAQPILTDSIIKLTYKQNSFTLEFSSDDYTNPARNTFSYQLEGLTNTWSDFASAHYAAFTNIDPGKYTFRLRARNSDGILSDKTIALNITVLPPFWRTWWFYLLCSLVALSIIGYILYSIVREKDLRRKQVNAELSALRAQLNPHFVFNSLTSLQHFIAANQNKLAIEYLVKFARLMRMILENSQSEIIPLSTEISFLELYIFMESLRLKDKVKFEIVIDEKLNPDKVYIPPMLIQPLIENSIVHGLVFKVKDGLVTVRFIYGEKYFLCRIEDNGIGREAARLNSPVFDQGIKKKSLGLKIAVERLRILNELYKVNSELRIIDIANNDKKGTVVEIQLSYFTPQSLAP